MNEHLMRAIIQNAAFLELSGDDVINPDAAVRELETLGQKLQMLDKADRQAFIEFAARVADEEAKAGSPQRRVDFIRSLPEALGLVE